ncbi:hypothetical protein ACLKA6_016436 [Drosophila palustris]
MFCDDRTNQLIRDLEEIEAVSRPEEVESELDEVMEEPSVNRLWSARLKSCRNGSEIKLFEKLAGRLRLVVLAAKF